jgi:hypothetical protein
MECRTTGLYADASGVSVCLQSDEVASQEDAMTRFESSTLPDSFSLEAAAHQHRSEAYGKAFDAAVNWVENHLHSLSSGLGGNAGLAAVHLHPPSSR